MSPLPSPRRAIAVPAGILALACAGAAFRAESPPVKAAAARPFAQIGGATTSIAIQPPIAYAGIGASLMLFDISDTHRPTPLDVSLPLPDVAEDLAIDDGYLYLATGTSSTGAELRVFDVRRPRQPVAVGTPLPLPVDMVGAVAAGFGHVVLATERGVLRVDVKDPFAPRVAAELPTGTPAGRRAWAADVAVAADGTAWIARPWGLFTLDLADPTSSGLAAMDPRAARAVAASGATAFVVFEDGTLEIWEPRDPAAAASAASGARTTGVAPGIQSTHLSHAADATGSHTRAAVLPAFTRAPRAVAAGGRMLFVVDDGGRRLRTFDVADPARPVLVDATTTVVQGSPRAAAAVAGDRLGVALERGGILTARVGEAGRLGRPAVPILPPVLHASLAAGRLYASAEEGGFFVLDVADPRRPRVVGALQAVAGPDGLTAIDPAAPIEPGSPAPHRPRDLDGPAGDRRAVAFRSSVVAGDMVYACTAEDGLIAIDVRAPGQPIIAGRLDTLPACHPGTDMVQRAGMIYLTTEERRLVVVDATDAHAMRQVLGTAADHVAGATSLALDGDHLYATGYAAITSGILHVLDVSDPGLPRPAANMSFGQAYTRIAVAYGRAFLSGSFGSVAVVDFAPPATLVPRPVYDDIVAGRLGIVDTLLYAAQPDRLDTLLTSSAGALIPVDRVALPWSGEDWIGESDVQVDAGRMAVLRSRAGLFTGVGPDGITDATPSAGVPRAPAGPPRATVEASARPCQPPARVVLVADAATGTALSTGSVGAGAGHGDIAGAALGAAVGAFVGAIDVGRIEVGVGMFDDQGTLVGMGRDAGNLVAAWEAAAMAEASLAAGDPSAVDAPTAIASSGRVDLGLDLAEQALSASETAAAPAGAAIIVTVGRDVPTGEARALGRAAVLRAAGVAVYAVAVGASADAGFAERLTGRPDRARVAADPAALVGVLRDLGAAATGCGGG